MYVADKDYVVSECDISGPIWGLYIVIVYCECKMLYIESVKCWVLEV